MPELENVKTKSPGADDSSKDGDGAGHQDPSKESDGSNQVDPDEGKWDEKTAGYIKSLRGENARYRTEAKEAKTKLASLEERFGKLEGGLKKALGQEENDEVDPATQVQALTGKVEQYELELQVRDMALEAGITDKEQYEFFRFKLGKALDGLEEGEELSDEAYSDVVASVKKLGGSGQSTTSVTKTKETKPPKDGEEAFSLDDFSKMTLMEKTELYQKDPTQYQKLMSEARASNLI